MGKKLPLSVMIHIPVAKAFERIFRHHVGQGLILDPTCGIRIMHKNLFNKPLFHEKYEFVFGDIDRGCKPQINLDCRKLPFRDNSFDCVILDPPYLQHEPTERKFGGRLGRFKEYGFHNRPTTRMDFYDLIEKSVNESVKVLKKGGILIIKCGDEYRDKLLFLHHVEVIKRIPFEMHIIDLIIYRFHHANIPLFQVRYGRGSRKTFLIVHSYFIVCQKITESSVETPEIEIVV